jgi:acyl-coenzyme A synthetase/AMP-(fatty) acid ligase
MTEHWRWLSKKTENNWLDHYWQSEVVPCASVKVNIFDISAHDFICEAILPGKMLRPQLIKPNQIGEC